MVSRRGIGLGLLVVGAGAAVGIALLMSSTTGAQPCQAQPCPTGQQWDPVSCACVPANPGASTFTLTINCVDANTGGALSGPIVTIDANTANAQTVALPAAKTLPKGPHTVTVATPQTIGSIQYTFGKWTDIPPPNTMLARAINLTSDITIGASFAQSQLVSVSLAGSIYDLSLQRYVSTQVYFTLNGVSTPASTVQLVGGTVNTLTAPASIPTRSGTALFQQWSDGVTLNTRNFTATTGLSFTAQYCCLGLTGIGAPPQVPFPAQPNPYFVNTAQLARAGVYY